MDTVAADAGCVRTLIVVVVVGNTHPIPTGTSGRFPSRTVTLFAPDDYYLGTRKFMDLLIASRGLGANSQIVSRIAAAARRGGSVSYMTKTLIERVAR